MLKIIPRLKSSFEEMREILFEREMLISKHIQAENNKNIYVCRVKGTCSSISFTEENDIVYP